MDLVLLVLVKCGLYNMGVTLLGCFSILRLEVIKLNFENSYETRMGLVLLVRRDEVYRLSLVKLQRD